jgi:hypothetical protein
MVFLQRESLDWFEKYKKKKNKISREKESVLDGKTQWGRCKKI